MTFGDLDHATAYLRFVEEPNPDRKTRKWRVESKSTGTRLGRIGWWGAWRQFVLSPHLDTVWNKGCLEDVQQFIDNANAAWKYEHDLRKEWERTGGATPQCCCNYGAAVSGEYPEFGCARCPVHLAGVGETELCRRHSKEVDSVTR